MICDNTTASDKHCYSGCHCTDGSPRCTVHKGNEVFRGCYMIIILSPG